MPIILLRTAGQKLNSIWRFGRLSKKKPDIYNETVTHFYFNHPFCEGAGRTAGRRRRTDRAGNICHDNTMILVDSIRVLNNFIWFYFIHARLSRSVCISAKFPSFLVSETSFYNLNLVTVVFVFIKSGLFYT